MNIYNDVITCTCSTSALKRLEAVSATALQLLSGLCVVPFLRI